MALAEVERQTELALDIPVTLERVEGLAGRIIDQFLSDERLTGSIGFEITIEDGYKTYFKRTPKAEKEPGMRRLAVFANNETASVTSFSDGDQSLIWSDRASGEKTHDPLKAGVKMSELLADFVTRQQASKIPQAEGIQGKLPLEF